MSRGFKIALVAITTAVVVFLITPPYSGSNAPQSARQVTSLNKLKMIAIASLNYAYEHDDQLPENFSVLFPKYLDTISAFYLNPNKYLNLKPFFPVTSTTRATKPNSLANESSPPFLIDAFSPYRFHRFPNARLAIIRTSWHLGERQNGLGIFGTRSS